MWFHFQATPAWFWKHDWDAWFDFQATASSLGNMIGMCGFIVRLQRSGLGNMIGFNRFSAVAHGSVSLLYRAFFMQDDLIYSSCMK